MNEQFYLTLPSNSSSIYYPGNTVANYKTHLPRTVQLAGTWEVAVVEVHFPCSFLTVDDNTVIYVYRSSEGKPIYTGHLLDPDSLAVEQQSISKRDLSVQGLKINKNKSFVPGVVTAKLPSGNYTRVEDVIDAINSHEDLIGIAVFEYDTKKVEIRLSESVDQIEMSHRLALQLGFDPEENDLKTNNKSVRPANMLLGLPAQMYIYCDIVEPQLIGDTMAPLLQIINIDTANYVYGANRFVQFSTPHYVPLLKTSFESLEIDLRDNTGDLLPFHFGTSCVKLHFRKAAY